MVDAEVQYEDQKTYRDVGTAPKVSMFKRVSAEELAEEIDESVFKVEKSFL